MTVRLRRRTLLDLAAGTALGGWATGAAAAQAGVLRVAFPVAETGFDPAQVTDLYSRMVTAHVFEGLYRYDQLARPYRLRPDTAVGAPEVSADWRTWTFRLRPGIRFADDPAFGGRPRELTAADYVYSWKRFFDPALKSPSYHELESERVIGLAALRDEALRTRRPFDYDREIEGLRALDRYTLQVRLEVPRPRFVYTIAQGDLYGALAREVVEAAGAAITERPVGTGPYRIEQWRRSSFIALGRNPLWREAVWDEQPGDDDAEGQAMAERLRGRRLPLNDRVEISIIEEGQPRWLAFLAGELDVAGVPAEYVNQAVPGGRLAPNLARRGMRHQRGISPDRTETYFNMEDPVVGGYTPERVALRRALALAIDVEAEIRTVYRGQAIAAQTGIPPHTYGYDPSFRTGTADHDPARAQALLDLYGYVDRDGDGWREQPGGGPLVLRIATQSSLTDRQRNELLKKNYDAIGVRTEFRPAQWPENMKAARAGRLMMWSLGGSASLPDGQDFLGALYGPAAGGQNLARFRNARVDQIFDRLGVLPDGPERLALFAEANRIGAAFMPYRYHVNRLYNDLAQPWIDGYRRPLFGLSQWQYIAVDAVMRAERLGR